MRVASLLLVFVTLTTLSLTAVDNQIHSASTTVTVTATSTNQETTTLYSGSYTIRRPSGISIMCVCLPMGPFQAMVGDEVTVQAVSNVSLFFLLITSATYHESVAGFGPSPACENLFRVAIAILYGSVGYPNALVSRLTSSEEYSTGWTAKSDGEYYFVLINAEYEFAQVDFNAQLKSFQTITITEATISEDAQNRQTQVAAIIIVVLGLAFVGLVMFRRKSSTGKRT